MSCQSLDDNVMSYKIYYKSYWIVYNLVHVENQIFFEDDRMEIGLF